MATILHETQSQIQSRIFTVRGVQVMIDRDLARLYQVQTKVLNQAVKRNINRFPERFMFQLNENEAETLLRSRSQIVTLNEDENMSSQFVTSRVKRGQNLKYLPFAFTEQGVTQLSAVLRSDVAVEMSIRINDAFHAMRNLSLLKIAKVKPDLSNQNPEGHYLQNNCGW